MYNFDDKMQKGCLYGAASLAGGGLIRGKSPIGYQLSQGISSGLGQFSLNGWFKSPILNSSNSFAVSTMLIGTFSPLMNQVPLVKGPFGEILNESIPGFIQGALEAPDKK